MGRGRPTRAALYERLDAQLQELTERFGGLPSKIEAEYIWSDIWHLEAHHSTAIEGNTLVLREVQSLLDQDRAVGAKPLKDYLEVIGYSAAATWVYGEARTTGERQSGQLITTQEIRHIHHLAMTPVWQVAPHPEATDQESPGNFRQHDLRPFGAGMQPPSWPLVPEALDAWVHKVNTTQQRIATGELMPEVMAELHNRFERVHPFLDGNGRTGRLIMNLLLIRLGYPPVVILKQTRTRYLRAMQKADEGDFGPLGEIIARAMLDNLNRFVLPNIAGPAKVVPLIALADAELSIGALRAAAKRGRLDAHQASDGMWFSTRKAVTTYKNSRSRGARRDR